MDNESGSERLAGSLIGPAVMLLSAAVFGYFGFGYSWAHQYSTTTPSQHILMVAVLEWAMRGGAIAFLLSGVMAMAKLRIADLLYSITGVITAVVFAVVAIWEWTNPQGYYSGVPAFLLVAFAAWNGYGSWMGLREFLAGSKPRTPGGP